MALTPDQIGPPLQDAFREALNRRAEASGRDIKAWRAEIADETGIPRTTFNNWLYGYTGASFEGAVALFVYFGPDFQDEVLGSFTGQFSGGDAKLRRQSAANLRREADRIDPDTRTNVTSLSEAS